MTTEDPKSLLETFENPHPNRDYEIDINCPEFTSVCPVTGQPDYGTVNIVYCPNDKCVELKSLKFYMQTFRNKGVFYEKLTNDILNDLISVIEPKWMLVTGDFNARGGITTKVTAEYVAEEAE